MTDPNTTTEDHQRAQLLHDHHKDTFQHILYYSKVRNRLFLIILVLLALLVLDLYSAGEPGGSKLAALVNAYIKTKLETGDDPAVEFDFAVIGSAAWLVLLALVIPYYKQSIHIDRQYRYIEDVEKRICKAVGDDRFITREGKGYESRTGIPVANETPRRPSYLRAVGPLYTYAFPSMLTLIVVWKLSVEVQPTWIYAFNALVGGVLVIYSILYVWWVVRCR